MPDWFRIRRRRGQAPANLSCRELVELVTDYLEGALPPPDAARFETHVAMCEGCTAYIDQMRTTIAVLGTIPADSLSPEAERDLLEAFREWKGGG